MIILKGFNNIPLLTIALILLIFTQYNTRIINRHKILKVQFKQFITRLLNNIYFLVSLYLC